MKNLLKFFFLIAFVSCNPFAKPNDKKKEAAGDWKTYDQSQYSIQYPSNWSLDLSRRMGSSFMIFSPMESVMDQFKENVNLVTQDLRGRNLDLDKYTEISKEQISSSFKNYHLTESKKTLNDSLEYQTLIFDADEGNQHLCFEQRYFVRDKQAFVLTFSAEQRSFAAYKEVGEKILNSFILK